MLFTARTLILSYGFFSQWDPKTSYLTNGPKTQLKDTKTCDIIIWLLMEIDDFSNQTQFIDSQAVLNRKVEGV